MSYLLTFADSVSGSGEPDEYFGVKEQKTLEPPKQIVRKNIYNCLSFESFESVKSKKLKEKQQSLIKSLVTDKNQQILDVSK